MEPRDRLLEITMGLNGIIWGLYWIIWIFQHLCETSLIIHVELSSAIFDYWKVSWEYNGNISLGYFHGNLLATIIRVAPTYINHEHVYFYLYIYLVPPALYLGCWKQPCKNKGFRLTKTICFDHPIRSSCSSENSCLAV